MDVLPYQFFVDLNPRLRKENLKYVHVIKQLKTHISNDKKLRNLRNEDIDRSQYQEKVP